MLSFIIRQYVKELKVLVISIRGKINQLDYFFVKTFTILYKNI
jgi:hypothetical protein